MKKFFLVAVIALLLPGCVNHAQNQFTEFEAGQQVEVEFGKIVGVRHVKIRHQDTGLGAGGGALAGAGLGNAIASGGGRPGGALLGLVAGAIAGGIAEHQLQNLNGIAYTITKRNGKTVVITQEIGDDDAPLKKGDRVMIETSGIYKRVLPTDDLPEKVKRPKDIKVED